ncbi:MAG: class B sortase [Oscillospiraceae bacterium]|nr:class B sortase [Oscillospiraceae bacterium]
MRAIIAKIKKTIGPVLRSRAFSVVLVCIGAALVVFGAFRLVATTMEYESARSEYNQLREDFRRMPPPAASWPPEEPFEPRPSEQKEPETALDSEEEAHEWVDPMPAMLEINPDFIGWITIEGLIDYPLVQGSDNVRYLSHTFRGDRNSSGAIFKDYRNSGFDDEVSIIYGHNMRNGSMFARLHRLRDPAVLAEHQYITIVAADWEILRYRIVAVRVINAWDVENDPRHITAAEVARAVRGAPDDAEHFLILSTCTASANNDERLRVYAALVEHIPAPGQF